MSGQTGSVRTGRECKDSVRTVLTIGLSSYNVRAHVPNDIPVHNGFIDAKNLLPRKTSMKSKVGLKMRTRN